MELKDKVAVVTGSSVGVGRAAALKFAERGCKIVINYNRSHNEAEEAAELCRNEGVETLVVQANVSSDTECRRLIQSAADTFGRLDILVNNAAVTQFVEFGDLEGLTEDIWMNILSTNLLGNFYCSRAAVPHMQKAGSGAIVNVVSIAGFLGHGSSIAYSASKAAVINMTKCLARTLGPEIRVNGVAPGAIDTRWLRRGLGEEAFRTLGDSLRKTTPLEVMATAEDVADAILWLASGASMMTGETIKFDGGQHLGGRSGLRRKNQE
ncbi:MAG: SDR family NAD(P)-dependent oxidoreductase [Acidobacteriota bacterium]